jgi:NitT/TauT family transport system substrate-binding protein
MNQRLKRIGALAACALIALLAVPGPARADDTLIVVSGSPAPGLNGVVDDIAQQAGFFKDEHLTVTTQYAPGAGTAAQLVASGKGDITTGSFEPALVGYEKGLRLRFFLSRGARYGYVMAVLADSPIKQLSDFKGATIGEVANASATELVSNSMLAGAGLTKNDYSYVPIGLGAAAINSIQSKRVAGVSFPYIEIATYSVVANTTFRVFRHPILNSIPNFGYAAAPATIAAKGDLLKRYSRALVKAAIFLRVNPAASARMYLLARGAPFTEDDVRTRTRELTLLEGEFPAADLTDTRIGYISPSDVRLYSRYVTDSGLTHQVVPAGDFVTDQFVAFANDFDHKAVIARAQAAR